MAETYTILGNEKRLYAFMVVKEQLWGGKKGSINSSLKFDRYYVLRFVAY